MVPAHLDGNNAVVIMQWFPRAGGNDCAITLGGITSGGITPGGVSMIMRVGRDGRMSRV